MKKTKRRLESGDFIAIVGSGLSGLSAALSLERAGFTNIHIYERDECFSARKEGYGLTLTYNPTGILHELGVLDQIANADCPSRSHYLFDGAGRIRGESFQYGGVAMSSILLRITHLCIYRVFWQCFQ